MLKDSRLRKKSISTALQGGGTVGKERERRKGEEKGEEDRRKKGNRDGSS